MNPTVQSNVAALQEEFRTLAFAHAEFPMLMRWGIEDFSQTIHSLGCNYLAGLGRQLGHWAITEYPIRIDGCGEIQSVRTDVAWWDKSNEQVVLIGEFERCEPGKPEKLAAKARSLLHAHRTLPHTPRVLLLVGWKMSGARVGDLNEMRSVLVSGFQAPGRRPVEGLGGQSSFVLAVADFVEAQGMVKLRRVRLP